MASEGSSEVLVGLRIGEPSGNMNRAEARMRGRSADGDGGGGKFRALKVILGIAALAAGGAAFAVSRKLSADRGDPNRTLFGDGPSAAGRGGASGGYAESTLISRAVTINRSRQELYDFWRDFTNLPRFMENVRSVTPLDSTRSHWVIEAPAGQTVEFVSSLTEDEPSRVIAWSSEEGADVSNSGRIEFSDAPPGRGTIVRATIAYDPPAGAVGRVVATLFQREPKLQARRDLKRFKQLMETGEVTTSEPRPAEAA